MAQKIIRRLYTPTKGLDLKSSDIIRREGYLSGGQNCAYDNNQNLRTRNGFQEFHYGDTIARLFKYKATLRTGENVEELISVESDGINTFPHVVRERGLTLTANQDMIVSYYYEAVADQFVFRVKNTSGTTLFSQNCGKDGSVVSMSTVYTAINGSGYFSSVTGNYSSYGHHAEIINDVVVLSGQDLFWPMFLVGSPSPVSGGSLNTEVYLTGNIRKPQIVQIGGTLYFSSCAVIGSSVTKVIGKYDGQSFYRAGLPQAPRLIVVGNVEGAINRDCRGSMYHGYIGPGFGDGPFYYKATMLHIGKDGRITEGETSEASAASTYGTEGVYALTFASGVTNPVKDLGYNDHCGIAASAMSGSRTVTMQAGHTLEVGDCCRFWNSAIGGTSRFVTREVIGVSGNDVTFSANTIDSHDTAGNFSCNQYAVFSTMMIAIWSTSTNNPAADYMLLDEVPLDMFRSSFTSPYFFYIHEFGNRDFGAGIDGGAFLDDTRVYGEPPAGDIIGSYNGALIISGNESSPNTVYYSNGTETENFPEATNSFLSDGAVEAVGQSGPNLAVWGDRFIETVYGDLATANFRKDKVAETIGCIARHTVKEIDEGIVAFLTHRGPFVLINGRELQPLGAWADGKTSIIEPYFTDYYDKDVEYPDFTRAIAGVDSVNKLYMLSIPWVDPDTEVLTASSVILVYDYTIGAWLPEWTIPVQDIVEYKDRVWLAKQDPGDLDDQRLARIIVGKEDKCLIDHDTAINSSVQFHWESLGDPNLYKKFLRLAVGAVGAFDPSSWALTVGAYVNYDYSALMTSVSKVAYLQDVARFKLRSGKANSLMIELSNNALYEGFMTSGFDLEIATPYGKPSSSFRSDD